MHYQIVAFWWVIVQTLGSRSEVDSPQAIAETDRTKRRILEVVLFTGVLFVSSIAVAVLAIVTPFVLAASALAAFIPGDRSARRWRPVTA